MTNEISRNSRSLLAAGAVVVAAGGAISGTMSPVVTIICAISLPLTFIWGPSWSPRVASVVGLSHLLLLIDLVRGVNDHDVRYALADAMLAVAGLHAAKLATRRDHAVAIGIQLTILGCGLSQLDTTTDGTIGALIWVVAWVSQTTPQLRELQGIASKAPRGRGGLALISVFLVAAALWAVLPIPTLRAPHSALSQGNSFATSGASSGSQSAAATPGIDRVGNTTMDLNARGHGNNTPVLLARGNRGLLRGEIFDSYDGTTFSRTQTASQALVDDQQVVLPASVGDVSQKTVEEITLIQAQGDVLSVGQPLQVGLPQPATSDGLGDVNVAQSIPAGTNYATVGGTPGPGAKAAQTPAEAALWLQLPTELPQRVRDLAKTWTAGTSTPAEAVAAIDAQLGATLEYDLDSPAAPPGKDTVEDVLFTTHRGFCEQFAASETILLRSLGIPARVIGGFAETAQQDGGSWVVTDSDAHAWVEYWRPGAGWITTDPTANVPLADAAPQTFRQRLRHDLAGVPWWVWVLIALGLGLIVVAGIVLRRALKRRSTHSDRAARVSEPPVGPVRAAFADLVAAGALAQLPLRATESPGDYLMRVPGGWSLREEILPALERELWGPAPPPDASTARAVTALGELKAGLAGVPV